MKPETFGEVNIILQNVLTEIQNLSKDLKENTNLSMQIHSEVKKTNGRVNVIEPLVFDYRERRAQAKGAITMWFLLGTVLVSSVGILGTLYLEKVQREIKDKVVSTLEHEEENKNIEKN